MGMSISSAGVISESLFAFTPTKGSVGYVKVTVNNQDIAEVAHIVWTVTDPNGSQVGAHDETALIPYGNHDFFGIGSEAITFSEIGTYILDITLTNGITGDLFDRGTYGIAIGAAASGWQWWQWALLGGGVVLGGIVVWKVVKIISK